MASHDLINTKPTILGATLGAIPGIAANPPERFSFATAFSERFFKNWGGPRAQECLYCEESGADSTGAIRLSVSRTCRTGQGLQTLRKARGMSSETRERHLQKPWQSTVGITLAIYRGQNGLFLENSEKSLKRGCRGLSAPRSIASKSQKRVKNWPKLKKYLKNSHLLLFFELFLAPGPRGPGNPVSDFFRSFLGRGLFNPCRWPTMSQIYRIENPRKSET